MRVLYLSDRLSVRGGADLHLRQVIDWAVARGAAVRLGCGRRVEGVSAPAGCEVIRIKGLASAVTTSARLARLPEQLEWADLIHVQNVMNPEVLAQVAATGRAVVTVQDHRIFCPGPGKTLPDGGACSTVPVDDVCRSCLPDAGYRRRSLELTRARLKALRGARCRGAAFCPGKGRSSPWLVVSRSQPHIAARTMISSSNVRKAEATRLDARPGSLCVRSGSPGSFRPMFMISGWVPVTEPA